jgi:hypothetical protein
MIHSDVDKNTTMPDGSGLPTDAVHAESIHSSTINGEIESPVGIPESPEDKGIIRCISLSYEFADVEVSVASMKTMDSPYSATDVPYGNTAPV